MINKIKIVHYVSSILFLLLCFVLNIFFRSDGIFPWLNLFLFIVLFIMTIISPLIALSLLVFVVPFTANISEHFQSIFNLQLFTLDLLSIDASIGFLVGLLFIFILKNPTNFYRQENSDYIRLIEFLLMSFHILIIITVTIAISRNLYQAASPYSVKGFFYNLANIRYTGWHDDYFPLKDLFVFTTVINLSLSLLSLVRTKSQLMRSVLCPLFTATVIILGYALCSKITGIGYNRDGFTTGVNSFLPDIHAYGGYALAAFVGGLYYLTSHQPIVKLAAGAFSLLAAVGVIVSASRFAIVMLFVTSLVYLAFFIFRKPKKYLWTFTFFSVASIAGLFFLNYWGSRGLFRDLNLLLKAKSFETINIALSYRPEIFSSALGMYIHYPILGLGKGIFYRQSSIFEFSNSPFLAIENHGENAHNYFLQILTETGIIGLIIFCAIFMYQALYLRNQHNQIVTVLILGIFLGNLYGHSLLIPNILVILFILLGVSNTEVQGNPNLLKILRAKGLKPRRYFLIVAATLIVIGAMSEVKTSYGKMPFQQDFLCYKQLDYSDQHTSGLFKKTYKVTGHTLKLEYTVYHPDTPRRPLTIDFNLEQEGQKLASYKRIINSPGPYEDKFDISRLTTGSDITLQIKTSRCFTPVNLGFNLDNRRLGIQLNKVSQDKSLV